MFHSNPVRLPLSICTAISILGFLFWRLSPSDTTVQTAQAFLVVQVYNQIYNLTVAGNGGSTSLNYTSPVLHTAVLTNLIPGTQYFYQVGDGTTFSSTFNFTALAAPSKLA